MAITLRSDKTVPLTTEEGDGNLTDLDTRMKKSDKIRGGYANYSDAGTVSSPISLLAGVWTPLTNDTLGAINIDRALPEGVTKLWDPATNSFDLSDLSVDDQFFLRLDTIITTLSANTDVSTRFRFGIGDANEFEIPIDGPIPYKTSGARSHGFLTNAFIGFDFVRTLPGKIEMMAEKNATVVVNGWVMTPLLLGEVSV